MRVIFKLLLAVLVTFTVTAQAQTELQGYLKAAGENNLGLKSLFSDYNAALERVPQVGALPDPNLSFGYFILPVETRVGPQQAKFGINQMFPWFGTLNAQKDVAIQLAKVKYEAFEEAKSKLFFEVKSTYFNIYFIQKGISITRENLSILKTFQQLALIKIETGKSSVVDEMRVEMEINDLENQLNYLIDSKWVLEVKFNKLLNTSTANAVLIPDVLRTDSLLYPKDALIDSISRQNHLIKQLDFKIASWEYQQKVAKKRGMPQFSIGVDYTVVGKSDNPNLEGENGRDALLLPEVGITIPLYRKKYKAMINESMLKMESVQFGRKEKQNQLTVLFENGYKDYSDAGRRISLYEKQTALADKSLGILLTSYSGNGENFEEVLRMERKVLKYTLELDRARADKNASVAFINYLLGK
ncbi:MAG: hypothetical protein COB85_01700 [Bacteroidetes bacterium]|nr:MAG: hypothetical protein COB85_01700 [Bacteroidota bacterium]